MMLRAAAFCNNLQRDLERIDDEIKRIEAGAAAGDTCKAMRQSPRVMFLKDSVGGGGSSSSSFDRASLLSRFPRSLSSAPLFVEAGSGYGEWVVSIASSFSTPLFCIEHCFRDRSTRRQSIRSSVGSRSNCAPTGATTHQSNRNSVLTSALQGVGVLVARGHVASRQRGAGVRWRQRRA